MTTTRLDLYYQAIDAKNLAPDIPIFGFLFDLIYCFFNALIHGRNPFSNYFDEDWPAHRLEF